MPYPICQALLWLMIGSCVALSSCRDDGTIVWSEAVHSPDGRWLVSADTRQWSGPGTAYVGTSVYLKSIGSSRPAVELLEFSDPSAYPMGVTRVKMTWLTPTHLDVTYGSQSTLDFQVVKCQGIEITVQAQTRDSPKASGVRNGVAATEK
ncbi:MAG: hypothetical protein WA324_07060 [Bryobacteraceae bacterium]